MNKLLSILMFVAIAINANAQKVLVSGYMGHTDYVYTKFHTGIRSGNPERPRGITERALDGLLIGQYGFKTENEIGFGKAFSNQLAVQVFAGYNMMSYDPVPYSVYGGLYSVQGLPDGEYRGVYGSPKIRDMFFGSTFKFFRRNRGGLAPMGPYFGLGFVLHNNMLTMGNMAFRFKESGEDTYKPYPIPNPPEYSFKSFELNASVGIVRGITDRLLLDVGVQTGWNINSAYLEYPENFDFQENLNVGLAHVLNRYYLAKASASLIFLL